MNAGIKELGGSLLEILVEDLLLKVVGLEEKNTQQAATILDQQAAIAHLEDTIDFIHDENRKMKAMLSAHKFRPACLFPGRKVE
jgi:uncharacterized protein YbaP (TraB family)